MIFKQEYASVEIQNGTWQTNLAGSVEDTLLARGYNVITATNAEERNHRSTEIIDYSDGESGRVDFNDWEHMDFDFFKNTNLSGY